MATINKTRPSCAKIKVQVDLSFDFPKFFEMEIVNEETKESRVEHVKIQYDMMPKYYNHCKVQGHAKQESRSVHPEISRPIE